MQFYSKEKAFYDTLLAKRTVTIDTNTTLKNIPIVQNTGNVIYHKVQSGQTLSTIAAKYRVNVSDIKRWNNLKSNMIYVGQKLKIYTNSPPKTSSTASTNATANTSTTNTTNTSNQSSSTSTKTQNIVHIVKSGETLSAIASKYGVSVENIKKWNNLSSDKLSIGQKLTINPTTQTSSKTAKQQMHTVKNGETLSSIANKYNTTVDAIMKANNLKSTKIYVGQKLKIQ